MQTYIAEIISQDDAHRVKLSKANNQSLPVEFAAVLDKDAALTVNGQATTLGELSRKLVEYQQADLQTVFSERGQLDIGSYLFGQLFGGMDSNERLHLREAAVDLRIVTEDEAAARLPWSLLYDDRRFLAATNWTVSLSAPPDDWKNVELPPSPRIMIVMPQPNGWGKTSAEAHLQELERTLSKVNSLHICGKHLCLVSNWEDFQEKLPVEEPDILYYYGHGDSDTSNSKLIFASRDTNSEIAVSAAELANALRVLGAKVPRLAYINCCLGDAGGLLGVGRQLGGVVPSVITNCTLAQVETAKAQALDIWRSILLDGLSPHEAVAAMRKNLAGRQAGGLSDARWLAPIVYCGYENWDFKPPKVYEQTIDPNWEYMLDRITPTGVALLEAGYMFDNGKPRALAFIWYGKQSQGVKEFYKRLEIELQNRFRDVGLYSPKVLEFETEFHEFDRSVSDMLKQAFEEDDYDKVADKIRVEANHINVIGKRRTAVYLRHPVIEKGMEFYNTAQVKNYLEWLDANFVSRLSPNVFAIIGLSFVVEKPTAFNEAITKRFDLVKYDNMRLHPLDELGKIGVRDLDVFFERHNIYLPRDRREEILDHIMSKTDGQYSNVLEELKLLRQQGAWNYGREDAVPNNDRLDEKEDF